MDCLTYYFCSVNLNAFSNQTKINAFRSFIRSMELDIILLQEVHGRYFDFPGYKVIYNIDNMRRGTAIILRDYIRIKAIDKSLDTRITTVLLENNVLVCSIYAPSGSQKRKEREDFFRLVLPFYLNRPCSSLVMGGDYNSITHAKDSTSGNNISPQLKNLIQNARLIDTWEKIHKNDIEYSFIRPNCGSRIDRIYVD